LGDLQEKKIHDVSCQDKNFAHGTTKIGQSKRFNCQAELKLYCFQAKPKFALKMRFRERT